MKCKQGIVFALKIETKEIWSKRIWLILKNNLLGLVSSSSKIKKENIYNNSSVHSEHGLPLGIQWTKFLFLKWKYLFTFHYFMSNNTKANRKGRYCCTSERNRALSNIVLNKTYKYLYESNKLLGIKRNNLDLTLNST